MAMETRNERDHRVLFHFMSLINPLALQLLCSQTLGEVALVSTANVAGHSKSMIFAWRYKVVWDSKKWAKHHQANVPVGISFAA